STFAYKYSSMAKHLLALLLAFWGTVSFAQDGLLDPSFDPGGGPNGTVSSMAVQSDGKIIIAGDFNMYAGTSRHCIARLNADGSLDGTFDPGTGVFGSLLACALQTDGKVIIGGSFISVNGTTIY